MVWCLLSSIRLRARTFTYVSMQLSFAKWFIAIYVDVCKQSIKQAGERVSRLVKPKRKKSCTHNMYTRSMPNTIWNNIVELISWCIHIFATLSSVTTFSCFFFCVRYFTWGEYSFCVSRNFCQHFVSTVWHGSFLFIPTLHHIRSVAIKITIDVEKQTKRSFLIFSRFDYTTYHF